MKAGLALWVSENDPRLPIVAFMAGRFMDEVPGMSFAHAGTIGEVKADTGSPGWPRPESSWPRRSPDPGLCQRTDWGMSRADRVFIGVEVDESVASDAALAAKLTEVCPVDIYARARTARFGSSRRASTSACSASCASQPRRRARSRC